MCRLTEDGEINSSVVRWTYNPPVVCESRQSIILFTINGTDIFDWVKQIQKEFLHSIEVKQQNSKQNKRIKLNFLYHTYSGIQLFR